jgi:hypothetical protein
MKTFSNETVEDRATNRHTPGPWIADGMSIYGPVHANSKHKNGRVLVSQVIVGTHRADPSLDGGSDRFGFDSSKDAKLIAASPELLEALYRAEDGLSGAISSWRQENGDIASTLGALKAVRAAIAKATK